MRNQCENAEISAHQRRAVIMRPAIFLLGIALSVGCSNKPAPLVTRDGDHTTAPANSVFDETSTDQQSMTNVRLIEVAHEAGIDWTVHNGEEFNKLSIVETLGAGCATTDYDRDGQLDILILGGGAYANERALEALPMALFRQVESWQFVAVQSSAGLPIPQFYSHGLYAADRDNDGFSDLLITGYGGLQLFHNQGDGTFRDVTPGSGLIDTLWSTAAAWIDLNDDGILDLFVGHYVNWSFDNDPPCIPPVTKERRVCSPTAFKGEPSSAFLSNGDGTYEDVSRKLGLDLSSKTLGIVATDLDDDGTLEIYAANDVEANQLYRRQPDRRYEDIGLISGTALGDTGAPDGSMGVDTGDIDGDGRLDLWVANFEDQSFAFYRNMGNLMFAHSSRAWGIGAVGRLAVGFGTVVFDVDGDGFLDIYCANGHVDNGLKIERQKQRPFLFQNEQGKRFRNIAASVGGYLNESHVARGLACADLDQNGALDLVVTHTNFPVALLRNDTPIENWLAIRLVGTESSRDAIGARVTIQCGNQQQLAVVKGGGSYFSTSDRALWFGLSKNSIVDRVEIKWPKGGTQLIERVPSGQTLLLIENKDVPPGK